MVCFRKAGVDQSIVRRVVFVWSVREAGPLFYVCSDIFMGLMWFVEHVKWISQVLNNALNAAQGTLLTVDPRIYITGPKAPELTCSDDSRESRISEIKTVSSPQACTGPRLVHGRPSIKKMLEEEITTSPGPVSVDGQSF